MNKTHNCYSNILKPEGSISSETMTRRSEYLRSRMKSQSLKQEKSVVSATEATDITIVDMKVMGQEKPILFKDENSKKAT